MKNNAIPMSLLPFHSIGCSDCDYADILDPKNCASQYSINEYTNYTNILQFRSLVSMAGNIRSLKYLVGRKNMSYSVGDISNKSLYIPLSSINKTSRFNLEFNTQFDPLHEYHPVFMNDSNSGFMNFIRSKSYNMHSNPKKFLYMITRKGN